MESPRSPSGSVRRHARNISHPTPRRTTQGPLQETAEDPLAALPASPSVAGTSASTPSVEPQQTSIQQLTEPASRPQSIKPRINLGFLRNSDLYHQLPVDNVPKAFLDSPHQPSLDASLPDLLQGGHYRCAADKALRDLLAHHGDQGDQPEILFQLLYTRLACLILISRPDIAAQEAFPLLDLLARNPPGTQEIVPIIPWELRLLLVRLQTIGAADGGRRGIMALYALAGEVRATLREVQTSEDQAVTRIWLDRLKDLGLRVCDALVEMGELETATRHLDTLTDVDADELAYRKALLKIRVGDVAGAQRCAIELQDGVRKRGIEVLLEAVDGDFATAVRSWQSLVNDFPGHEALALNAAVSMLYTGQITHARNVLEDLARRSPMFPTILFNLSVVYELCTERAVDRKLSLAQQAAEKNPCPESGGWERATFEFKL